MEGSDSDNEANQEKEFKEVKCKISYLNNTIDDFDAPGTLYDFINRAKALFFQNEDKNCDVFISYEDKKKNKKVVNNNKDYNEMLKLLKDGKIKEVTIETDKVPSEVNESASKNFEDEIRCVVESELNAASERIKKTLSGNFKFYPNIKIQKKRKCNQCNEAIVGTVYKSVTSNDEYFCQNCLLQKKAEPAFFILH